MMAISTTPEKLQQVGDEIGDQAGVASIPFIYVEGKRLKLKSVQIRQNTLSASNSFILGHPINGKFGVATGLGGSQIVFGQSGSNVLIDLMKRSYQWENRDELENGKKTSNIDITQGFLQLGNVTVKNIYLTHKSK